MCHERWDGTAVEQDASWKEREGLGGRLFPMRSFDSRRFL